jgi:hypothetical protein
MSTEIVKPIAIIPSGTGFKVSIPGEAIRLKATALAKAEGILQVTSADEQQIAINAVADLKSLADGAETARAAIKKPYWDAGKAIDAKAKEFVADIDARVSVIEGMIGKFQAEERRKQREREMEEERQRQQAAAAEQRERDRLAQIERDRIAAEQAASAAKTKKAKEAAEAELRRVNQEKVQAQLDLAEAENDRAEADGVTIGAEEAPKATGASVREKVEFVVVDIEDFCLWDIQRRAEAAKLGRILPSFVRIEVSKRDFNEYINLLDQAALDSIPGMTFHETTKVSVRAAAPFLQ